MEPEQQVLRTGLQVAPECPEFRRVILKGVGPRPGPVRPQAAPVGLMVVRGRPVGPIVGHPGSWSVVMALGHDMMEPEGHGVIDHGFPGAHKQGDDGGDNLVLVGERHPGPLLRDG